MSEDQLTKAVAREVLAINASHDGPTIREHTKRLHYYLRELKKVQSNG
jgi:hypothetical protein